MKTAFHFDEQHLRGGEKVIVATLKELRRSNKYAHTKLFTGTLLFSQAASETSHNQGQTTSRVNNEKYADMVNEWASPQPLRWHALRPKAKRLAFKEKVFAVCLETIDPATATSIHSALRTSFQTVYLGAIEVDESLGSHLGAYQLIPIGRIDADAGAVFWDGITEDSKMHYQIDWFKNAGFAQVTFASLSGRYSLFDRDHGIEQIHRDAQSRQWMRELLDGVNDHVMRHLSDGAPEIPEKLWNALNEYRIMKVSEQASNVALACRRIFESVADALFPPTADTPDGRKLGTAQYKNRLLKYLEEQLVGQTEQKLVVATMETAAAELDNLYDLTNKGLHSDFVRVQARRCLLRTLLLLDDLVAVRQEPLPVRIREDTTLLRKLAES